MREPKELEWKLHSGKDYTLAAVFLRNPLIEKKA
jgi:hypothetical protein